MRIKRQKKAPITSGWDGRQAACLKHLESASTNLDTFSVPLLGLLFAAQHSTLELCLVDSDRQGRGPLFKDVFSIFKGWAQDPRKLPPKLALLTAIAVRLASRGTRGGQFEYNFRYDSLCVTCWCYCTVHVVTWHIPSPAGLVDTRHMGCQSVHQHKCQANLLRFESNLTWVYMNHMNFLWAKRR